MQLLGQRAPAAAPAKLQARPARRLPPKPRSRGARAAAAAAAQQPSGTVKGPTLWQAKRRLLQSIEGTERGGEASKLARAEVEEAQVLVETFAVPELDFGLLEGKWRLLYTTASDVLPLVRPPHALLPLAPLAVGRIYQRFSSLSEGRVENIIELEARLPPLAGAGVALVVEAAYEPRTSRSIALAFKAAGVGDVRLSPEVQNLVASPLLPRGWWNLQLLMALRDLSVRVPFLPRPTFLSSSRPGPVGLNYLLTYLDEDMLIGRAQGNGGTFIFSKEVPEEEGQGVAQGGGGGEEVEEMDLIL